jgi:hypothetical protein
MKFQLTRVRVLSLILVAMGVASSIFIAVASLNYGKLYPAISQLGIGVSEISFGNSLAVRIFVSNPVDYTGLVAQAAQIHLYFSSGTSSLFQNNTITDSIYFNTPIASSGNTTLDWTLHLSTNQTVSLTNFYHNNQNVVANYSLSLGVASFLQGQAGSSTYEKEGEVPLLGQ